MTDIRFFGAQVGPDKVSGVALVSQRVLAILCTDSTAPERFGAGTIFPSLIRSGLSGYGDNDLRGIVEIAVDSAVGQYNASRSTVDLAITEYVIDAITRSLDRIDMTWTLTTGDGTESTVTETVNL